MRCCSNFCSQRLLLILLSQAQFQISYVILPYASLFSHCGKHCSLAAVRNQLLTKSVEMLDSTNRAVNFKVEVNSFFGWTIAEVHKSLVD
jgi:hypothetical protein